MMNLKLKPFENNKQKINDLIKNLNNIIYLYRNKIKKKNLKDPMLIETHRDFVLLHLNKHTKFNEFYKYIGKKLKNFIISYLILKKISERIKFIKNKQTICYLLNKFSCFYQMP